MHVFPFRANLASSPGEVKRQSNLGRRLRNKSRISAQHTNSNPHWLHCDEEATSDLLRPYNLGPHSSQLSVGAEAFFL